MQVDEKEFLITELESVLDMLKSSQGVWHTEFSGGLDHNFSRDSYGEMKKGLYAHYQMNMSFSILAPKKGYKRMPTNAEYKEALADMVKWFGKYPEMIPAPDCFEKYKAAIDNAKRLLEE